MWVVSFVVGCVCYVFVRALVGWFRQLQQAPAEAGCWQLGSCGCALVSGCGIECDLLLVVVLFCSTKYACVRRCASAYVCLLDVSGSLCIVWVVG